MHRHCLLALPALSLSLAAQSPIQVGQPLPELLDLGGANVSSLVPKDSRDPAQLKAAQEAWIPLIERYKSAPALRLRLPRGEERLPLLLAASQALKAQNSDQRLYLAYDPEAPGLWTESAWGALQGGILSPEDLGGDPSRWRDLLVRAQEQLPGRPWILWLNVDPEARASVLLGDGGRLMVPPNGSAARLALSMPAGELDVEGGLGDLTVHPRNGGPSKRWRFQNGAWASTELPKDRHEITIAAKASYDVQALLAKMRATQLRDRIAIRTQEAKLEVNLHLQGERGTGADLGFIFQSFEKGGETEEVLQKEVLFNGVKANIRGEVQLPIVEARASLASPVALGLTERYRYVDGGPGSQGQRRIRFEPVDDDPLLYQGELLVDETNGRVIEERSSRGDLPGVVKSENRILTYGEPVAGIWRIVKMETFERWVTAGGVSQVRRTMAYSDYHINEDTFEADRQKARASSETMMKQTPDGMRYFTRQSDGSRKIEQKPKASGRGVGAVVIFNPKMKPPVLPGAGFAYFDFNALDRGIQVSALVAGVFNTASVTVPNLPGGFDVSARGIAMLWPSSERPVRNGKLSDGEAVDRNFGGTTFTLGRDLGAGFRLEGSYGAQYDHFQTTKDKDHKTPDFALPPSGWSQGWRGTLDWQYHGFQISTFYGGNQRPEGSYGTPQDPQTIPENGKSRYWGGLVGLDHLFENRWQFHGEVGRTAGHGFDRFLQLGGEAEVSGVDTMAVPSDRTDFAKLAVVLPPSQNLRLTFSVDHARLRALDNHKIYGFTGLNIAGDIPGFWWFTTVRMNLNVGLQSDISGLKEVSGYLALLRLF